jgi:uncharacterized membrane protein YciS (DUF1049 family)
MIALSRWLFVLLLAIAALMGLAISALNAARIEVELAFVRVGTSLGMALVAAFTLGLLAGLLWQGRWVVQLLIERGRLRRELRVSEARNRPAAAGTLSTK